jgi:hypothetical protein
VFCWLVKTILGNPTGARQAKAALAHGDGPGGDLE